MTALPGPLIAGLLVDLGFRCRVVAPDGRPQLPGKGQCGIKTYLAPNTGLLHGGAPW